MAAVELLGNRADGGRFVYKQLMDHTLGVGCWQNMHKGMNISFIHSFRLVFTTFFLLNNIDLSHQLRICLFN